MRYSTGKIWKTSACTLGSLCLFSLYYRPSFLSHGFGLDKSRKLSAKIVSLAIYRSHRQITSDEGQSTQYIDSKIILINFLSVHKNTRNVRYICTHQKRLLDENRR